MFDKTLFKYFEETHTGFYDGKLVPSITQLISVAFPLDPNIKEEVLKKAATRGTTIHNEVEKINKLYIDGAKDNQVLKEVAKSEYAEIKDYYCLLKTFNLKPIFAEQTVFLLDKNGELIAYGHYDFIVECVKSNDLFNCLDLYLFDLKTTSVFDKKKTQLQTQIYRVAIKQAGADLNELTCGIWLRDGNANIYPFATIEDSVVIQTCKILRKIWDDEYKDNLWKNRRNNFD